MGEKGGLEGTVVKREMEDEINNKKIRRQTNNSNTQNFSNSHMDVPIAKTFTMIR